MQSQVACGVTCTILRMCVQEPVYRAFVKMLGEKVILYLRSYCLILPVGPLTKFLLCSLL